ncbi:MAG TPA: ParB/RepB/Spo0J family partition protein [Azospirillum sp.]|nr:ParB/RepB/Spo0J family partition protein [Azospirillum sp.]
MSKPKRANVAMVGAAFGSMFGLSDPQTEYRVIDLDRISPNPFQPRRTFDAQALDDLARSIGEQGVLQPILVRPNPALPDRYEIVAGERRWRASELAGKDAIPAMVATVSDADMATQALLENIQREDLTPVEEAFGYRRLLDDRGFSQDELAARIGKSKVYVSRVLKICALDRAILDALAAEPGLWQRISMAQLIEIGSAPSSKAQLAAWEAAKAGVGSKALRDAIAAEGAGPGRAEAPATERQGRAVRAPLMTLRASYGRWAKAFEQVRPDELEGEDRAALRALRDRLNAMNLD